MVESNFGSDTPEDLEEKPVKIKDVEILEDDSILVEFNETVGFNSKKAIFTPEVLLSLAMEYGVLPMPGENDFKGVPVVEYDDVFPNEEEGEDILGGDGDSAKED